MSKEKVTPQIAAYTIDEGRGMVIDYRCDCGMGIAGDYTYCPYCGAELDWDHVSEPSQGFVRFLGKLKL